MKKIIFLFLLGLTFILLILNLLYKNNFISLEVYNPKLIDIINDKMKFFMITSKSYQTEPVDFFEKNIQPTIIYITITIVPTTIDSSDKIQPKEEWGKLKKIGEHSYTMKVRFDEQMATPEEIFEALNEYRYRHRKEKLLWDQRLADYASKRARYFTSIGRTDEHQGFIDYIKDINNVKSLGFWSLGENSSYGYRLSGVHLIEWIYGSSPEHNSNQLDERWTHVGIGVDGYQTDIIFGGDKIE